MKAEHIAFHSKAFGHHFVLDVWLFLILMLILVVILCHRDMRKEKHEDSKYGKVFFPNQKT